MDAILLGALSQMDSGRAFLLRLTLSNQWLRRLFLNRAARLLFLFSLSLILNLGLSIYSPVVLLTFGPLILGFPHLIAGVRFVDLSLRPPSAANSTHRPVVPGSFLLLVGSIWAFNGALRLLFDFVIVHPPMWLSITPAIEIVAMAATLAGFAQIFAIDRQRLALASLVLTPLIIFSWITPVWMFGFIILLHNFIAFPFWIRAAKGKFETWVAIVAMASFTFVSVLLMFGFFDGLHIPENRSILVLGRMVAPWAAGFQSQLHFIQAYAFGQAIHYFVWLKAIPDQQHHSETPTSFRQSWSLLKVYAGRPLVLFAMLGLVATGWLVWWTSGSQVANTIYFSLASYHGFMEIAGLALIVATPFATERGSID